MMLVFNLIFWYFYDCYRNLVEAIARSQCRKAAGVDGISPEIWNEKNEMKFGGLMLHVGHCDL